MDKEKIGNRLLEEWRVYVEKAEAVHICGC